MDAHAEAETRAAALASETEAAKNWIVYGRESRLEFRPQVGEIAMFAGIQALRAYAAVSVLLLHAIHYGLDLKVIPTFPFQSSPHFLAFGVTLFFSISGFLMAKLSEEQGPLKFMSHRSLRIYPPFWMAIALVVSIKLSIFRS